MLPAKEYDFTECHYVHYFSAETFTTYSLFNISMGSSTTRCKGLVIMKKGFFQKKCDLRHEFFFKDNSKLKNCAGMIKESTNISVKNFTDKYFYLNTVLLLVFRIEIHKM